MTRKNLEVLSEKENQIENSIENNNEETNDMDLEDVASVEPVKETKTVNKGKNAPKSKTPVKGKQQQQQQQKNTTLLSTQGIFDKINHRVLFSEGYDIYFLLFSSGL